MKLTGILMIIVLFVLMSTNSQSTENKFVYTDKQCNEIGFLSAKIGRASALGVLEEDVINKFKSLGNTVYVGMMVSITEQAYMMDIDDINQAAAFGVLIYSLCSGNEPDETMLDLDGIVS